MIRTVGQLREALAEFPDYRPIAGDVPPPDVEVGYGDGHSEGAVGFGGTTVDVAPADISNENAVQFTSVALEGGPTVVIHGDTEFGVVLIDPEWVERQCDEAAAWVIHELRERLAVAETHRPCCSSHGRHLTCADYRRTHFVEVGPCCSVWATLDGDT